MTKSKKHFLKRLTDSKWIITLTSTMLGVTLGLYLKGYSENKSLLNAKKNALIQVSNEITENNDILLKYNDDLKSKFTSINYLFTKLNSDMKMIVHKDSIDSFKKKIEGELIYNGFEEISNNNVKINGSIDFKIDSPLMLKGLSSITWESYKQTNYLSITKFQCLRDIEGLYELQNEINKLNYKWKENFIQGTFIANISFRNEFMTEWRNLIMKQELLLKIYGFKEDMLKNCS